MSDTPKRLRKSADKMIFGVCGGVAHYLSVDPTLIRVAWVILVLLGGTGILLYLILALVMPPAEVA